MIPTLDQLRATLIRTGSETNQNGPREPAAAQRNAVNISEKHSGNALLTSPSGPPADRPCNQSDLMQQLATGFGPARAFEPAVERLMQGLTALSIEITAAADTLAPVRNCAKAVRGLAENFCNLTFFQQQLADCGREYSPLKELGRELSQVGEAFHSNLIHIARALEPAKKLSRRLADMVRELEQMDELRQRFDSLAEAFKPPPLA